MEFIGGQKYLFIYLLIFCSSLHRLSFCVCACVSVWACLLFFCYSSIYYDIRWMEVEVKLILILGSWKREQFDFFYNGSGREAGLAEHKADLRGKYLSCLWVSSILNNVQASGNRFSFFFSRRASKSGECIHTSNLRSDFNFSDDDDGGDEAERSIHNEFVQFALYLKWIFFNRFRFFWLWWFSIVRITHFGSRRLCVPFKQHFCRGYEYGNGCQMELFCIWIELKWMEIVCYCYCCVRRHFHHHHHLHHRFYVVVGDLRNPSSAGYGFIGTCTHWIAYTLRYSAARSIYLSIYLSVCLVLSLDVYVCIAFPCAPIYTIATRRIPFDWYAYSFSICALLCIDFRSLCTVCTFT